MGFQHSADRRLMRRPLLAGLLASTAVVGAVVAHGLQPGESLVRSRADGSQAQTFSVVDGTECWQRGVWVIRPESVPLSACTPPPATTMPPTTTTPPPTTQPPTATGFVEMFDGNTGLDRFDFGVYHRDESLVATRQWSGDHDLNCGSPDTQRVIHRDTDEWIYLCRDHLMTSIGDTSGYSLGWFAPKQTFTTERTVSWDVNVTDLGTRQWWEVAIVPASFNSGVPSCPQCSAISWISETAGVPVYPAGSVVVGNGPFGGDFLAHANGRDFSPSDWQQVCSLDPEGCSSKAIRRTFTITDNGNNTLTLTAFGRTYTFAGSFPASGFRVVFKDHNYTPDKGGTPVGHTWHWDNIAIR